MTRSSDFEKGLCESLKSLFNNREGADIALMLGDYELPAHSVILTAQSGYFRTALRQDMQEAKTKTFKFTEGSMAAHWRVIEFMYTGDYSDANGPNPPPMLESEPDDEELMLAVEVYVMAKYFQVPLLPEYALEKHMSKLEKLWCSDRFPSCIRAVYASTVCEDDDLRQLHTSFAGDNLKTLLSNREFCALIKEGGDFPLDLLARNTGRGPPGQKNRKHAQVLT